MRGNSLPFVAYGCFSGAEDHGRQVLADRSWEPVPPMKVLVTGGTSGLGFAMASALAAAGVRVALTGRSGQRASSIASELPGEAVGIELDARDESSVVRAVGQAWSQLGGIDMLVNNAGMGMSTVNPCFMTHPQGFWEVPVDSFRMVIEANLTGYFLSDRSKGGAALDWSHRRQ